MSSTRLLITKTVSPEGDKKYSIKTTRGSTSDRTDKIKGTTKDDFNKNDTASSQTTMGVAPNNQHQIDGTFPYPTHRDLGSLTGTKEHTEHHNHARTSGLRVLKPGVGAPLWRRVQYPATGEWRVEPVRLTGYIKNNRTKIRIFNLKPATTPNAPEPLPATKTTRRKRKLNIRRDHDLASHTH